MPMPRSCVGMLALVRAEHDNASTAIVSQVTRRTLMQDVPPPSKKLAFVSSVVCVEKEIPCGASGIYSMHSLLNVGYLYCASSIEYA